MPASHVRPPYISNLMDNPRKTQKVAAIQIIQRSGDAEPWKWKSLIYTVILTLGFSVNGSWKFYLYIGFIRIYCTWLMTIFKYLLIIVLAWSVDIPSKVILYKLTSQENLFDHNLLSTIPIVLRFRTEQGSDNAMCFAKLQSDWAMEMDVMDKKWDLDLRGVLLNYILRVSCQKGPTGHAPMLTHGR